MDDDPTWLLDRKRFTNKEELSKEYQNRAIESLRHNRYQEAAIYQRKADSLSSRESQSILLPIKVKKRNCDTNEESKIDSS